MHTDGTKSGLMAVAEPSHNQEFEAQKNCTDWRLWCRLCAKDDLAGNISVFFKDEQQSGDRAREAALCAGSDQSLSAAIGKYFWVEIKREEELPKMLCTECFSLVTALVNFSERVAKVQQMFCVLLNAPAESPVDQHAMRLKYGLLDEEREHVLMQQQQLPEVHYYEAKPKINMEPEERIFEQELATTSTNPLEQTRIKLKIKKEHITDEQTGLALYNGVQEEDDDELYDCEQLLNENYEDEDDEDNEEQEAAVEELIIEKTECKAPDTDDLDDQPLRLRAKNKRTKDASPEPLKKRRRLRRKRKKSHKDNNISDGADDTADEEENEEHDFLDTTAQASSTTQAPPVTENAMATTHHCSDCPRKFKRIQHFRQHMKRAHSKPMPSIAQLTCGQCSKRCSTARQLEAHLKVHLPPELRKVVPCPYCEKRFSSHTLMQTHIKYIHMNERPFICEECGVAVRTNAALKTHMLTHTDYAPYECAVCKKGFKNQIRLRNHMETHDPNKHICAECGLQLNSRATLNRHLLVHSDEMQHKCDYCGRAFKRAKALKNHLILHTGLKPYSCDFCERTFANGSNCRSHKKKAHPEELAALEAAGGGKTYTRNIPKLEALKAVTKAADNLAPVVSKQSGRFAFGKKPKQPPKETVEEEEGCAGTLQTAASISKVEEALLKPAKTASVAMPQVLTGDGTDASSTAIPNIDNIYSHIMKQATLAAHNANNVIIDAAHDAEHVMHIKRPVSQASSCVANDHEGTNDVATMQQQQQQHQQQQHHQQQQQHHQQQVQLHQSTSQPTSPASIVAMPSHFYTQIIKHQQLQHQQQLQQLNQQQPPHPTNQHLQLSNPSHLQPDSIEEFVSIRSPDSRASSHLLDDQTQSTSAVSVQFYNHIRQNLQGPYM